MTRHEEQHEQYLRIADIPESKPFIPTSTVADRRDNRDPAMLGDELRRLRQEHPDLPFHELADMLQ